MIDFKITPDGGEPYELTATARDVLVWERTGKRGKVFNDLAERQSMIDLYHLAWIASRRLGHIGGEVLLGEFEERYEIEADPQKAQGEEGPAGPTRIP